MRNQHEARLLLLCARPNADAERMCKLAHGGLDWRLVLDYAERCSVGPVVYSNLRRTGHGRVPDSILEQLRTGYYWNTVRNEDLYRRLGVVRAALAQEQIPTIVLKGAALAELVYPERALRSMGDVDVLVPKADLSKADRVLLSLGYTHTRELRNAEWYRQQHHHLNPHVSKDRRCVIELHHHIVVPTSPAQPPIENLWKRARKAQVASVTTRVLSPEDLLLHLCLHFWYVGERATLRILCDAAETIDWHKGRLDWDLVLDSARSYQATKYLYYALWFAQRLLGAELPADVMRALAATVRPRVLERLVLRMVVLKGMLGQTSGRRRHCFRSGCYARRAGDCSSPGRCGATSGA